MNINKGIIDKLVQTNENISRLFSSLNSLKDDELKYILDEISRIKKEKKPKKKKKDEAIDVDKEILKTINTLSDKLNVKPKIEKPKPVSILKNIVSPKKVPETKQSESNFERKEIVDDIQEEKLKTLKSISSRLIFKKIEKKDDKKKSPKLKDKFGNIFDMLGTGFKKGRGAIKKFGVGKALGIGYALKSGYDLFKGIKEGYNDYKKFKKLGDNVSAENALFKTFIGSSGNLFNIIATFVPGPFKVLLYSLGGFMTYTASQFDSIIADKSNFEIQSQQKTKRVMDLIKQGEKNNLLLLRPTTKNWEYKDYSTGKWKPLLDSEGNPITTWTDRVQTVDKTVDGVQRYKLKTNGRLLDMVLVNGVPKLKSSKGFEEIAPREKGGTVQKNKKYLVGEKGEESFVRKGADIFSETFNSINKNMKRIIDKIPTFKDLLKPSYIQYSQIHRQTFNFTGHEMIDFSNVSENSLDRFKEFYKQLSKFEGGFSNVKGDKGGKTNFGITQATYSAYLKKNELADSDVANISKDVAEKIAYEEYYIKSGADEIADPKMAYLMFDTYFMAPAKAKELYKKYGNDVEQFIQARKEFHLERSTGKDQSKFKEGWLNRIATIENMVKKNLDDIKIDSVKKEFNRVIEKDRNSDDQSFLLNNIVPLMADAVTEAYGK